MALMTPEQFEASLKEIKPKVFMNGKRVTDILKNRNTRTVVEANKASYAWALDPKYQEIMTCFSPLVNEVVNRYTYVSASIEDLVKKAEAGTFTAEMLGTCIYRCVGYDAFHALASTTWEMDRDLGTEYQGAVSGIPQDGAAPGSLRGRGPDRAPGQPQPENRGLAGPLSRPQGRGEKR